MKSYIHKFIIILILFVLTNLSFSQNGQDKYKMRLGINGGMYPSSNNAEDSIHAVTKELDSLDMVWLRHPGKGTAWYEVQRERETWDWSKYEAVFHENNHPWVIELYGQIGTVYPFGDFDVEHLYSLGNKQDIMNYIKAHGVDMQDSTQRADAEHYVKIFINRYKDRIKYWEIGNEGINSPNRFDVVTCTYPWIKEVHPDVKVILTAVAGDDAGMFNEGIETMDSLLYKGIGDYFDIANFHWYGKIAGDFEAGLEERYDDYKGILNKYGIEKPIWITETSTSSHSSSVLSGPSSEQIQARHVVIRAVVFFAKGAEKVFWHDYKQTFEDNKFYQCNLIDPDTNIPKPSYYTFKLLVNKLGYFKTVETLRTDDVRLYKFINHQNRPIFVAWTSSSQTIDISSYFQSEEILITHIIEDNSIEPATETASITNIHISESPIFIEKIFNTSIKNSEKTCSEIPSCYKLYQNFPNPFNSSTTICFFLPESKFVKLQVFNLLGKEIDTLVNNHRPAGKYEVKWNPEGLSSGLYLYTLKAGEFVLIEKLLFQK